MHSSFVSNLYFQEVAPFILKSEFLTPKFCALLIEMCEAKGSWTQFDGDEAYATHDINFDESFPDIFKSIEREFMNRLVPFISEYFDTEVHDIYSMFAIKYEKGLQTSLDLHRDDSYISASIKLNNEYTGGELEFPEQNFTNKNIAVGTILIFPGSITHPHKSTELESGTKYSLTIWTKYPTVGN